MPKFNIKAQAIPTVASAYADVIGTTDNQIVEIRNELIIEDSNQRFQIHDETIEQLAERIAMDGQLSPCIVAPLPNGKYELIDGRHRRRAVIKAGLPTTKCIIKTNLTDKQKQTIRLTSNLIRNNDYLPSELAFAYKELAELEDMKTISEETNLSKKKIYRYIRLTYLLPELLFMVDNSVLKEKDAKQIAMRPAVELSYLTVAEQRSLLDTMSEEDCTPSHAQAIKMRSFSKEGKLTKEVILSIMQEEKPNQKEQVKISKERISKFFAPGTPVQKMEETIVKALEMYRKRQREKER